MEELQEAIETYSSDSNGFDSKDLQGTMTDIMEEVNKLPRAYADLLEIFKPITNKQNIDEYVSFLADDALREEFYNKFSAFARIFKIALATVEFHEITSLNEIQLYKEELKKFAGIRVAANATYLDTVSFTQYEKQLQKLLDQHVITEEIIRLVDPVNILDSKSFEQEVEKLIGPRAKAEKIAAATSKYISVNIDTDPILFKKMSELIRQTISDMRANRLSELEALKKLKILRDQVINGGVIDLPEEIKDKRRNVAVFHLLQEEIDLKDKQLEMTLMFDKIVSNSEVVDWHKRIDIINKIELEFGDYLMDVMDVSFDKADELTRKAIEIAIANK